MQPDLSRTLALGYQRIPELKVLLDQQQAEKLESLAAAVRWVYAQDTDVGDEWSKVIQMVL